MRVGRIFLCQPRYGNGAYESQRVFLECSTRKYNGSLTRADMCCSLLAYGFNALWCQALNLQVSGEDITHFAMLHSDIVPEGYWLDKLMEDLEKYEADVVSAVVPLKEMTGLTSTAIDDPSDTFQVERRLTMEEVYRLPEVFSAADCGYPNRALLANTGCWVCDFTKDWRFNIHFEITDRIIKLEDGKYAAQVNPEDWNFSRQLHKLGGKVLASRRVGLSHQGILPYSNRQPWGDWDHDQNLGHKFGKASLKPSTNGKHHKPKAEADKEGQTLQKLATDKRVLVIGSDAKTTEQLAQTALIVHWVSNNLPETIDNKVVEHDGTIADYAAIIDNISGKFDLILIDDVNDYESVLHTVRLISTKISPGALVCFKGYEGKNNRDKNGTTLVVDALLERGAQLFDHVGDMAIVCLHYDYRPCRNCGYSIQESQDDCGNCHTAQQISLQPVL